MTCRAPARVTFSFDAFARRGGQAAPHRDGWGVALVDGNAVQLFREPVPAAESPMVRFLHEHPPVASLVLSHIRLATHGGVCLANTQPYSRELGGRTHVFAHNGHVPGVFADARFSRGGHHPLGDTDSEVAFCALLRRLEPLWREGLPSLAARRAVVAGFARELSEHGPANFLYTDGDALFAHGHRRTQADQQIRPPGLYVLCRRCGMTTADGGVTVAPAEEEQHVLLVASVPLTDEPWRPLAEGELLVARAGTVTE